MDVVELSFKNMYELGHMVVREKEELLLINDSQAKLQDYEKLLQIIEHRGLGAGQNVVAGVGSGPSVVNY
jgi:UDP-N-acetylenolpyruvoylglucosamine reductase